MKGLKKAAKAIPVLWTRQFASHASRGSGAHRTAGNPDVVIVGAGHNGLVSAALLAKQGMQVHVVEAKDVVGGACRTGSATSAEWHRRDSLLSRLAPSRNVYTHQALSGSDSSMTAPQSTHSGRRQAWAALLEHTCWD
jgi:monoamine oxidase